MYTTDRADVYIAVKTPDAAKVDDLFKQHRIDFSVDDDVTGPFGSDESLIVFFFSEVKHANMEQETALLMNNMIPFSMFHEEGNDFDSGWSHSRLMPDGTMSFTKGEQPYVVASFIDHSNVVCDNAAFSLFMQGITKQLPKDSVIELSFIHEGYEEFKKLSVKKMKVSMTAKRLNYWKRLNSV